ncbi:MAG: glycosyltransferase family 2 protein [Bacteroidetes bacterium]|nr:glycosyltransferase family 2 protein [Bacteroidota bacterium]
MMQPFVSVIIPCFNEEKFIGTILDNLISQDYPHDRMEIMAVDGNSKDQTQRIIKEYAVNHPFIKLVVNERQYVPFALNMGIRQSKGDFIIILGSHAEYSSDYISALIRASLSLDADNVGGLCKAKPPDDTLGALAISKAISCSFGVGNAHFRIGSKGIKKVDTVTFGCYKRSVFDRIGLFDEELLRNQDDEFNARLVKSKGSIYLIPDISVTYFTRKTVKSIVKMFFQYGLFKPLVSLKIGKPTTIRQLVPFFFVLFLLTTIPLSFFYPFFGLMLAAVMSIYLLTALVFSVKVASAAKRAGLIFFLPWLFFLIHLAYGWGYLRGIIQFIIMHQKINMVGHTR